LETLATLTKENGLGNAGRLAVRLRKGDVNQVKALQLAGHGNTVTVRQLRYNWRTVRKWVLLDELSPRTVMAPRLNTPSGFVDHLARRWSEGCRYRQPLPLEIQQLG
jgi:hypothetical protein